MLSRDGRFLDETFAADASESNLGTSEIVINTSTAKTKDVGYQTGFADPSFFGCSYEMRSSLFLRLKDESCITIF